MKKTNKAVLSKHIESKVLPVEDVPHPSATIIDAMGPAASREGRQGRQSIGGPSERGPRVACWYTSLMLVVVNV